MVTKNKSMAKSSIESRVSKLEEDVASIAQTVYDLIDTLQRIPDPPCPPMCSETIEDAVMPKKRRSS